MSGDDAPSLRDRNKARARAEIAATALLLFSERGFEGVTVDQIVTKAGVSRRTFFRYFETKEDALLADYPELINTLTRTLIESGSDHPLEAVRKGLHRLADWYIDRSAAVLERSSVIRDAMNLAARNLEFMTAWEGAIAASVALRLGADPGSLVPRTAGAVLVAAFRSALTQWVRSSCSEDLHALVDRALDLAATGLRDELDRLAPTDKATPGRNLRHDH